MHKTLAETREWCVALAALLPADGRVEVAACPPFTALDTAVRALAGTPVWVAAQTVNPHEAGAHTGEVSAGMVADTGARGAIVGHSERRAMGEDDAAVTARLRAALGAGLVAILCVGESLAERERGETRGVLERQLSASLSRVDPRESGRLVIAYEPVWAIGTGVTATPDTAQEAVAFAREVAARHLDAAVVRILYGGSVTPGNAAELFARPDIDGGLVGGASLDPAGFAAIVAAA
jgi:triosephosphate isomerase